MSYVEAELQRVTQITPDVKQFVFDVDEDWEFEAGRHISVKLERDDEEIERPYNVVNKSEGDELVLAVKRYPEGEMSPLLHDLNVGQKVQIKPPRGNLTPRSLERDIVLISTGTGATAMYNILREYLDEGEGKVYYFHGEKTKEKLMFKQQLEMLESENENMELIFALSDEEWHGREGFIQNHVNRYFEDMQDKDYYICGVPAMVVQTKQLLKGAGVSKEHVITEGWEDDAVSDVV